MIRLGAMLWVAAIVASSVALYQVEHQVRALEEVLAALNGRIVHNRQAVHILEAEWSYLNDPRRLAELSRRHLELAPVGAGQLAAFDDLPARWTAAAVAATAPALDPDTTAILAAMGRNQ